MKCLKWLALLMLFFPWAPVAWAASYLSTVQSLNPNGIWMMNDASGSMMLDSGTYSQSGSYYGTVALKEPPLIVDGTSPSSALFDGSSGHAYVYNSNYLSLSTFTFVIFVRYTGPENGSGQPYAFIASQDNRSSGTYGWELDRNNRQSGGNDCQLQYSNSSGTLETAATFGPVFDGNRHMLVVAMDSGHIYYSLDGAAKTAVALSGGYTASAYGLLFAEYPGTGYLFQGYEAGAALFPTVLSDSNIASLYAAASQPSSEHVSTNGSGTVCTSRSPCSLATAISQAVINTTIYVANGIYSSLNLSASSSGAPGYPIVLQAANLPNVIAGAMPTVRLIAGPGDTLLQLSNHSWWTVAGFEFDGNSTAGNFGIFSGSSRAPSLSSTHLTISNNYVHDFGNSGIQINNSDYITISQNVVTDNAGVNCDHGSGISMYTPQNSGTAAGFHNYIQKNISYLNHNPMAFSCSGSTPTDGNGIIFDDPDHTQSDNIVCKYCTVLIENNLVYGNDGAGIKLTANSGQATVRFNTAYKNRQEANIYTWRGDLDDEENVSPGNIWADNIVYCDLTQANTTCILDSSGNTSTWYRNMSYDGIPGSVSFNDNGDIPPTSANFFGTDPLLSNPPTSFQPSTGSPALGAGGILYGMPTTDFAGVTRSATAPSLGAYEQ